MHHNAVARCNHALQEIEPLRAPLRLRERQRFERQSEKDCTPSPTATTTITPPPKRPRDQQCGHPSSVRRCHDYRPEHPGQADETHWLAFATLEGQVGHRWYLWAVQSEQTIVFLLDASRWHDVPEGHLGPQALLGILHVDRYRVYKARMQVKEGVILSVAERKTTSSWKWVWQIFWTRRAGGVSLRIACLLSGG